MTSDADLDPEFIAQAQRAFALHAEGRLDEASELCTRLIADGPPFRDILHLKGLLDLQAGNAESARQYLEQAEAMLPGLYTVLFQLALCYDQLDEAQLASDTWAKVIEQKPDQTVLWIKRAYSLRSLGDIQQAGYCIDKALELEPDNPKILHEKGYHLHQFEQDWEAAEHYYIAARELSPDELEVWVNFALMSRSRGRWQELKDRLFEAHQQFPDDVLPEYYFGMEQLREGDFRNGWPNYEGRYQRPEVRRVDLQFKARVWQGEPLQDKHLLFWTDQGIGEELLGLHIAAPQIQMAAQSTIVCSRAVQPVAERCFAGSRIVSHESIWEDGPVPTADVQASFSQIAVQTLGSPDAAKALPPSITANPELVANFREKYRADDGPLIGFAWKSPKSKTASHKASQLTDWEPLFSCEGVRFVCLQYGVAAKEKAWIEERLGDRVYFDDSLVQGHDMDAWMAQVAAMDLVISVSTTTAHLAGVSRTPAWTLLTAGDGLTWYWFLERSDSPWYPETKLYRQPSPHQWASVFQNVASDLNARFGQSSPA